jgi:hypothetical protein
VAETHVGLVVVEVSTAETGSGNLEEDLVALKSGLLGGSLDDLAGLRALVDGEGRHLGGLMCSCLGIRWVVVSREVGKTKM